MRDPEEIIEELIKNIKEENLRMLVKELANIFGSLNTDVGEKLLQKLTDTGKEEFTKEEIISIINDICV